jgi:hypothetical protein
MKAAGREKAALRPQCAHPQALLEAGVSVFANTFSTNPGKL